MLGSVWSAQLMSTRSVGCFVVQDSVVGRCEVIYQVTPLPKMMALLRPNSRLCDRQQMYEIIKSRNYSNCQLLSEDHAHLPARDCTPPCGANCGNFWTVSLLTAMNHLSSKIIHFIYNRFQSSKRFYILLWELYEASEILSDC